VLKILASTDSPDNYIEPNGIADGRNAWLDGLLKKKEQNVKRLSHDMAAVPYLLADNPPVRRVSLDYSIIALQTCRVKY
jgi:hypothetical protein